MLTLNSSNKVTFSVNVHGTAATPTVRCVVGEYPGLQYPAVKLQENQYEVLIDLPKTLQPGAHDFKVEVLLNGRLFTPINTKISVEGETGTAPAPAQTPEPVVVAPVAPVAPAPAPVAPAPIDIKSIFKTEEVKPVRKPTPVKTIKPSKPLMSALESVVKAPVQKRKTRVLEAKPIEPVSIKSIANAIDDQPVVNTEPQVVVEHVTTIPVTLVKGDVVYK